MIQLQGTSWRQRGPGAEVYNGISTVHFNENTLLRLGIHQGNPELIAELIDEAKHPTLPHRVRIRTRKPSVVAKRIR